MSKTIEDIQRDRIWIYANWEKLCKTHGKKVIGVDNAVIVASADSFGHLKEEIRRLRLNPAHVVAQYINSDPDSIEKFLVTRDQKIDSLRNAEHLS